MTVPRFVAEDLDLLRFVLDGEAGTDERLGYWAAWADSAHIDDHSEASFDLFPAAYRTLVALDADHRWLTKLKGVYRQAWTRNRLHHETSAAVAAVLGEAGLDFLAPWDTTIEATDDHPATVFGLGLPRFVTRWTEVDDARQALQSAGWSLVPGPESGLGPNGRLQRFDRELTHPDAGSTIRLADHLLPNRVGQRAATEPWTRARPTDRTHGHAAAPDDIAHAIVCRAPHEVHGLKWALQLESLRRANRDGLPDVDLTGIAPREAQVALERIELFAEMTGHRISTTSDRETVGSPGAIRLIRDEVRAARRFPGRSIGREEVGIFAQSARHGIQRSLQQLLRGILDGLAAVPVTRLLLRFGPLERLSRPRHSILSARPVAIIVDPDTDGEWLRSVLAEDDALICHGDPFASEGPELEAGHRRVLSPRVLATLARRSPERFAREMVFGHQPSCIDTVAVIVTDAGSRSDRSDRALEAILTDPAVTAVQADRDDPLGSVARAIDEPAIVDRAAWRRRRAVAAAQASPR